VSEPTLRDVIGRLDKINDRLDETNSKLDETNSKLDTLTKWQENLSAHVEDLNISLGAMSSRLGSFEQVLLRVASKTGVTGLPSIGGIYIQPMPLEAKKPDGS
jgi:chromosome segregation ATPase